MQHPLIRLAGLMDWELIEHHFASHFTSGRGRPALPPRLVAGLLYLQHANYASDEMVVNTSLENPYWQVFTGDTVQQTELPIDVLTQQFLHRSGYQSITLSRCLHAERLMRAPVVLKADPVCDHAAGVL